MIPFSVLDLAPITAGGDAAAALRNTLDLARHVERLGYNRFWLAEHHNMPGIASAATSVVIAHVAGGTATIRVGAGGIMLPNHAPLVIAEQFGTLESLHPGRIDLGLGRAPGTDALTMRALRRSAAGSVDTFPQDVVELQAYFRDPQPAQLVRAVPGAGLKVPIWLLGSSFFSAELAARLGLPFAFASHFAPDHLMGAIERYRRAFQPSAALERPYVMVGAQLYAADTDEEARRLFTSPQQQWANRFRGLAGPLPAPVDSMDGRWSPEEAAQISHMLTYAFVGAPDSIRRRLGEFLRLTSADEVILATQIFDHAARLRSYAIAAEVRQQLSG
jgi:luciferase family oxidoreductase group 1